MANAIVQPVVRIIAQTMFYKRGRTSKILNLKIEDVDLENRDEVAKKNQL